MDHRLLAYYRYAKKATHAQIALLATWLLACVPGGITRLEWLALVVALLGGPVVFGTENGPKPPDPS